MNNNEETKPSKDMMEIVHKSLNDTYDLAVSHCIKIVEDTWLAADHNTYNVVLSQIKEKLNNLKNKSNG